MGFRKDAYCTVWEIEPKSNTLTKGRISVSRKNKNTGEWETDFSGYVDFVGTACAAKATKLMEKDRIKLGDVDVSTWYNEATSTRYTNFKIFSFEDADGGQSGVQSTQTASETVDNGEIDDSQLPF